MLLHGRNGDFELLVRWGRSGEHPSLSTEILGPINLSDIMTEHGSFCVLSDNASRYVACTYIIAILGSMLGHAYLCRGERGSIERCDLVQGQSCKLECINLGAAGDSSGTIIRGERA